jgi:hypothetical protein
MAAVANFCSSTTTVMHARRLQRTDEVARPTHCLRKVVANHNKLVMTAHRVGALRALG